MGRVGPGLLVITVLLLVAASYPAPAAVGYTGQPRAGKAEGWPAEATDAGGNQPPAAPSRIGPVATPTATKEEVGLALAKLRSRPEQTTARTREAAVELPRRIRIPALEVEAGFEFVGLAEDGTMDVPKDPNQVAWYRLGPRPGEQGNAVVAGHVDWGGKAAVFWGLSRLKPGDSVEVIAADERKYEFTVQWLRWYDADRAPVEEVFGQSEATELTLITCGGAFDQKTRQYLSRVVARAVLR